VADKPSERYLQSAKIADAFEKDFHYKAGSGVVQVETLKHGLKLGSAQFSCGIERLKPA